MDTSTGTRETKGWPPKAWCAVSALTETAQANKPGDTSPSPCDWCPSCRALPPSPCLAAPCLTAPSPPIPNCQCCAAPPPPHPHTPCSRRHHHHHRHHHRHTHARACRVGTAFRKAPPRGALSTRRHHRRHQRGACGSCGRDGLHRMASRSQS